MVLSDTFLPSPPRTPTEAEWADFQKHARRMRDLTVDTFKDLITPQVLLPLQLRADDKPFTPRLKTFECEEATEAFIPFIPLFLSPKTIDVNIGFAEECSTMAIVSLVIKLSTLCPDLEYITLRDISSEPIIVDAVSEMALTCNRNSLQGFRVECPLTKEAREVVYQLPRLTALCTAVYGPTPLPTVLLPNLTVLGVECENDVSWLQGFRGAKLEKLQAVAIDHGLSRAGDFLEAFESVALTTLVPNTLSSFRFYTIWSWDPNYRSLLPFKQLQELEIKFSCSVGCSSEVDDDTVISLAQAMPKLEILRLGGTPCRTPGSVTVDGLTGLACGCPRLLELRAHFDATSLAHAAATAATRSPSEGEPVVRQWNCALKNLDVGAIPVPEGSGSEVASTLLRIFPRIRNVIYATREWHTVAGVIRDSGRVGASACGTGGAIAVGQPSGDM